MERIGISYTSSATKKYNSKGEMKENEEFDEPC